MLYTSSKVYEFLNSVKTRWKTCTWNVEVLSNKWRYRWVVFRSVMLWVSFLSLRSLLQSILKVSSFCQERVASCRIFSELLIRNSSSKTRKNSSIGSTKVGASMVGGMFAIATMSCWGERFTEISTEFGLLGTVQWCAMAACSVTWKVVVMVVA